MRENGEFYIRMNADIFIPEGKINQRRRFKKKNIVLKIFNKLKQAHVLI